MFVEHAEAATGGVLYNKGIPRNFGKFTEKNLCQSLFYLTCRPEASNFIKIKTLPQVFSHEFCEIPKNNVFSKELQATGSEHKYQPFVMLKSKVRIVVAKQDLC